MHCPIHGRASPSKTRWILVKDTALPVCALCGGDRKARGWNRLKKTYRTKEIAEAELAIHKLLRDNP